MNLDTIYTVNLDTNTKIQICTLITCPTLRLKLEHIGHRHQTCYKDNLFDDLSDLENQPIGHLN